MQAGMSRRHALRFLHGPKGWYNIASSPSSLYRSSVMSSGEIDPSPIMKKARFSTAAVLLCLNASSFFAAMHVLGFLASPAVVTSLKSLEVKFLTRSWISTSEVSSAAAELI